LLAVARPRRVKIGYCKATKTICPTAAYHNLSIVVAHQTIPDLTGRPQCLVDHKRHEPIRELVG
jgi:hypothetical protein